MKLAAHVGGPGVVGQRRTRTAGRSWWAVLALLLLPAAGLAQGKGHGVEVRVVSPKLMDTARGHILGLSVRVTNQTTTDQDLLETLTLPPGWQPIVPTSPFTLRPGETTTRVKALQVPRDGAAGRYELRYRVHAIRDLAVQDDDTVAVTVIAVTQLALLVEDKPDSVLAGEAYEAQVRLVSSGNRELAVTLQAATDDDYHVTVAPARVNLAAGQSIAAVVRVETDAKERKAHTNTVRVRATPVGGDAGAAAGAVLMVDVVPRQTASPDLHRRLPVEATVRLAGDQQSAGTQVLVHGRGPLDAKGHQSVDFLVSTPDRPSQGPYGLRSESYLNLLGPDWRLRLGDQSYSLSPLTSSSRYGRGVAVGAGQPQRGLGVDGYYVHDRWARPDAGEFGGAVTQVWSDRLSLRANYYHQLQDASGALAGYHNTIWSVQSDSRPFKTMNLNLEYARGSGDRSPAGRRSDDAWRLETDGAVGQGGYFRASWIRANPDYYGYYHDSDFTAASLTHPLVGHLQGRFSYSRYASNLSRRPTLATAPRETLWQAGLVYETGDGWSASVDFDGFKRLDKLPGAAFDFRENALRLGAGWTGRQLSLRLETRVGDQRDRVAGRRSTAWGGDLFASWTPAPTAAFTLHGGVNSTNALAGSRLLGQANNFGAAVQWQPTPDLDLDFWYDKYNFAAGDRPETNQYRAALNYTFENDHRLSLEALHNTRDLAGDTTAYLLSYTIPFGVPVGRKADVGALRGRVIDSEAPGQSGVAGVLLHFAGATAVTNTNGEFVFTALPAGRGELRVDRKSIGLDRVTREKLPLVITIKAGASEQQTLRLVRSATLSGQVLRQPPKAPQLPRRDGPPAGSRTTAPPPGSAGGAVIGDPNQATSATGPTGLPNILVELTSPTETLRRVSDQQGRFVFDGLRPGAWHLKVYTQGLPELHYLETAEQDLLLAAGERRSHVVNVLPKSRRIEWIDQGAVQSHVPTPRPGVGQASPAATAETVRPAALSRDQM